MNVGCPSGPNFPESPPKCATQSGSDGRHWLTAFVFNSLIVVSLSGYELYVLQCSRFTVYPHPPRPLGDNCSRQPDGLSQIVFSCLAYIANKGASVISDRVYVSSSVGALVVGICGNVYGRFSRGGSYTSAVPGLMFLVPVSCLLAPVPFSHPSASLLGPVLGRSGPLYRFRYTRVYSTSPLSLTELTAIIRSFIVGIRSGRWTPLAVRFQRDRGICVFGLVLVGVEDDTSFGGDNHWVVY